MLFCDCYTPLASFSMLGTAFSVAVWTASCMFSFPAHGIAGTVCFKFVICISCDLLDVVTIIILFWQGTTSTSKPIEEFSHEMEASAKRGEILFSGN